MSILYCAIACGRRVLCEQSVGRVDFAQQIRGHLGSSVQEYVTFAIGGCTYNCFNWNGLSFIAVTEAVASQQQTLKFLMNLKELFTADPSRVLEAQSGAEHCHQVDFGKTISAEMAAFSSQDKTRMMQLQGQVADVSLLMQQNITDLNERGTKLNELVDKTDQFQADANMFVGTARGIRRKAFCENLRMNVLIFGGIAALVLVVLVIILWKTGAFGTSQNTVPSTTTPNPPTRH